MISSKPLAGLLSGLVSLTLIGTYFQVDVRSPNNMALKPRMAAFPSGMTTYILHRGDSPVGISTIAYHPHGDSLDVVETNDVRLPVPGGGVQKINQRSSATIGPTLAMEHFFMTVTAVTSKGDETTTIEGARDRVRRDQVHAVITAGNHVSKTDVTLDTSAVFGSGVWPVLAVSRQMLPHQTLKLIDFDPTTLHGRPMTLVFGDGRPVRMFPESPETIAYDITQVSGGITTHLSVTALGMPVSTKLPLGLSLALATPQNREALRKAWARPSGPILAAAPDSADESLIAASAIQAGANINAARDLKSMTVRVGGDTLPSAAYGSGQSVHGDTLTVTRQDLPIPGRGGYVLGSVSPFAQDPVLGVYTRPEPFLESDSPEIKKALAEAVPASDREDPVLVTVHVTRWVYLTVKKEYTASLPSAAEVARVRVGDCNEHTALATAMLRAAGIPARPVSGVVLVGNAFYFHAWVEVWLGGHWIPVDPTFGLAPADPARVRLAHDWSDLTSVLVYLGTLKLDVTNTTHLSPND